MEVGDFVTIHSEFWEREDALVVGEDWDSLTGENQVFQVWHPAYGGDDGDDVPLEFYQKSDGSGRCLNVGNDAIWIE